MLFVDIFISQKSKKHQNKDGESVTYLNSGDWVENMTSLEYNRGKWRIYNHTHFEKQITLSNHDSSLSNALNYENLFNEVVKMN